MQDIGHSSLLKFFVKNTMSEKNIESNVPGEHNIREVNEEFKEKQTNDDKAQTSSIDKQNDSLSIGNTSEIATADFTLSPVITVTKNEATFTKGDLKLQKVTVTEDISHISTNNEGENTLNRRLTYEMHTSITQPKSTNDGPKEDKTPDSNRLKSKIPMSRLRQAVNKVKNDIKEKKRLEKEKQIASSSRKSSIPRLKDSKIPSTKDTIKKEETTVRADEEFDRIFQELNPIEDASMEFSFEEIMHAYEDNKITQTDTDKRQSMIPLLKRKSEHEIEIPKTKEKQTLKKSNSVDTKINTTLNQGITGRIVSEQTKNTEIYKIEKETNKITNNNTIVFKNQTSLSNIDVQNQIKSNQFKETIKIATPVFDIQTTGSTNEVEDLTQDITITKNLNFDKETVSKIYKIDFTENNFDSLDMTILNEYNESKNITKENSQTLKSTKTFERANYEENLNIESISEIKAKQTTENNNLSKLTFEQSLKTKETSENIEIGRESLVQQVSLEKNEITETKAMNINTKTSTIFVEETNNYVTAEISNQSAKINERHEKQELHDTKTIEFETNQSIVREMSLEENKTINNLTLESTKSLKTDKENSTKQTLLEKSNIETNNVGTLRQVSLEDDALKSKTKIINSETLIQKTSERNERENLHKVMDKIENFEYKTSTSNSLSIPSIKSLETNESSDEKQNEILDKTSFKDSNENSNIEMSIECLKNKRSKSTKLEELSRRYENIEFDIVKKVEANKNIENKTTIDSNKNYTATTNMRIIEEIRNKNDQSSNKDNIKSNKSVTVSANKHKEETVNTQHSTISTEYLNTKSNQLTMINTNITASNKLNKTDLLSNSAGASTQSGSWLPTQEIANVACLAPSPASPSLVDPADPALRRLASGTLADRWIDGQSGFKTETNNIKDIRKSLTNLNVKNTEEINTIYSDVFTKMNSQNKHTFGMIKDVKEINSKTDKNENNIPEIDTAMEEDIPILKGKVNRVIRRISSIDNSKSVEKSSNDLPKKKSVLSKIQMFERGEPDEVYPKTRITKLDSKTTRIPNPIRQTSIELRRPKIVKEIYKETIESKTKLIENTSKEMQEETSNIEFEDERHSYNNTKLNDESYKYCQTDNKLLKTNFKVKDFTTDVSNSVESQSLSNSKAHSFVKQNISQILHKDIETHKSVSNTYTKIYTNNKLEKSLITKEYESNNTNKNETNDINNDNLIYKENKAKSLEYITQNSTMISYDRLQSDIKDGRTVFDTRRTTSVAELEIGGVVKGRVHEMITRINSMEILTQGKKDVQKEQPRKSSVSEKIALFEGKLPPVKMEKRKETYRMKNETEVSVEKTEEEYTKKIIELKHVKNNYECLNTEYLELRDNSEMPVIALGTALLDKRLIRHVVEAAIDMGYRAIDTAFIYGNEKEIGEAINNKINDGTVKREDLYIISKLWSTYHRKDLVEKACRQSLNNMGLEYFDLYLIHNPMSLLEGSDPLPKIANVLQYSVHDYMDAWQGIEDLIVKGLVRRGGVSNFNSEQVHRIMEKGRIKPVVNQVECHPYLSQERLGGFCDAYGMRLSCYGVLGSKGTPAEHKSDLPPVIDDPLVLVMSAGLGVTPGQMLIAYQLHNSRSVVIKATSAAHLYDNLKAQFISLEDSHLTALKSLNKNKRTYYLKGLGETHKNYPFYIAF
ncbi:PREDICTED: MATH and LRR domain-containing protein PFE0570w-like [Papilio xuthus]|uniref:MATH and LRR domain-containing protein PFE0570w-like n=1 Tax=Papilio xuthus TaxID=66420 RepID=A0AAJ6ZK65_PAPXU|nr:PREDICTED: MATH and LRR domain-containing protein PFE0570w-like [Papilio xuthus]